MIQRHTVGSTPPAVETGNAETREAEMRHDLDLVQRHATEGIVAVIGQPARFGAVTVAAQVGGHDGEMLRKARCDKMPVHMGQRVAVQEQHGRSAAADHPVDLHLGVARLDIEGTESIEHVLTPFLGIRDP